MTRLVGVYMETDDGLLTFISRSSVIAVSQDTIELLLQNELLQSRAISRRE